LPGRVAHVLRNLRVIASPMKRKRRLNAAFSGRRFTPSPLFADAP